jgi:hypothetical protein
VSRQVDRIDVQASGGEGTDIVAPPIRPGADAVQEQGDAIAGALLDHPDADIPNAVWIRDHLSAAPRHVVDHELISVRQKHPQRPGSAAAEPAFVIS